MSILALMAYELDEPLAALMSSSARHSAIDFTLRNADSRVYQDKVRNREMCKMRKGRTPIVRSEIAWFTLRRGETSTA